MPSGPEPNVTLRDFPLPTQELAAAGARCAAGLALAAALVVLLVGCEPPPRPWQAPPDGGVVDESQPYLPSAADGPPLGDAGAVGDASMPTAGAGGFEPAPVHRREGGLWSGCHAGFVPAAEPLTAVTRLALACGPVNGMRRKGRAFQGQVHPGQPSRQSVRVAADACYRVIAVASSEVVDLDVAVTSSRGTRVAADDQRGRWLLIDPDRPFCSFTADTFTLEVSSREGSGRYALEVWELR